MGFICNWASENRAPRIEGQWWQKGQLWENPKKTHILGEGIQMSLYSCPGSLFLAEGFSSFLCGPLCRAAWDSSHHSGLFHPRASDPGEWGRNHDIFYNLVFGVNLHHFSNILLVTHNSLSQYRRDVNNRRQELLGVTLEVAIAASLFSSLPSTRGPQFQSTPLLMTFAVITGLKWYLPGFPTGKSLFFKSLSILGGEKMCSFISIILWLCPYVLTQNVLGSSCTFLVPALESATFPRDTDSF